jgi:calcineurin-like phosphoesterase family protein
MKVTKKISFIFLFCILIIFTGCNNGNGSLTESELTIYLNEYNCPIKQVAHTEISFKYLQDTFYHINEVNVNFNYNNEFKYGNLFGSKLSDMIISGINNDKHISGLVDNRSDNISAVSYRNTEANDTDNAKEPEKHGNIEFLETAKAENDSYIEKTMVTDQAKNNTNNVTVRNKRIVFISDIHFSDVYYNDMSPGDRVDFMIQSLNEENKQNPIDIVFFTGDLCSNIPDGNIENIITNYLPKLEMPYFCLAGNHDIISADEWKKIFCYDKQYIVMSGEDAFICLNPFRGTFDAGFGNQYVKTDLTWFNKQVSLLKNKNIYIVSHWLDEVIDADLVSVINNTPNIIALFQGHEHNEEISTVGVDGKPKFNCGQFSYTFSDLTGWNYRLLNRTEGVLTTAMIYPAKKYPTFTQVYKEKQNYTLK